MKKRIIRILTFVFGLYFILEFLLPKEIGGNFDKLAVKSPAVIADGDGYSLYYVGKYDGRNEAIGLAKGKWGSQPSRIPGNPVLRSNLFNSYDRGGFSDLTVVKPEGEYQLFYFGYEPGIDRNAAICWATSDDGVDWLKQGRMQFSNEVPWRQYYETEKSYRRHTYAALHTMAAYVRDGHVALLIAFGEGGKSTIRVAEQEDNGSSWVLADEVVELGDEISESAIIGLSCVDVAGEIELWIHTSAGGIFTKVLGPDEPPELILQTTSREDFLATHDGEAYRAFWTIDFKYEKEEEVISSSSIVMTESPDGEIWSFEGEEDLRKKLIRGMGALEAEDGSKAVEGSAQLILWRKSKPEAWENWFSRWTGFGGEALGIIGSFAIGLGVLNMCLVHSRNITRTRKQVYNSVVFFVMLLTMFVFTLWGRPYSNEIGAKKAVDLENVEEYEKRELSEKIDAGFAKKKPTLYKMATAYNFMYDHILLNLSTAVFSLVSFYMVGAAFRSFRIRSIEALLLVVSAIIVMLGQIPIGARIHELLPKTSAKLLMVANAAAYRGVILGMTVGALSMSLRLWLGLERGMFHGTD